MSLQGGPEIRAMDKRFCPFIAAACKGAECALWLQYDRADGVQFQGCTFVLQPLLTQQVITEQMRTQATHDKVATEINGGFALIGNLAISRMKSLDRLNDSDSDR